MKLGFYVHYKNSFTNKATGVWGDEMLARGFCEHLKDRCDVGLYTLQELVEAKLDVCIHTNQAISQYSLKNLAKKNVLWIQGFTYTNGGMISLDDVYNKAKDKYDLVITSSRKLADKYSIPFVLPFTGQEGYHRVNTDVEHDISFIGNIIKNTRTMELYLSFIGKYNYELYGGDFGKISHQKALEVISGSKININFGFEEGVEWDMVIARPLYIASCEAFCLSDKVPWLMETFGSSMRFTDGGDKEEMVTYYIENKDLRKKMAKRSFEIVKSLKIPDLLEIIGG